MAIVVKPDTIYKGENVTFSLSKNSLAGLLVLATNPYFQDITNWQKVILSYKSSVGNQTKVVEFYASEDIPVGNFISSTRARDLFEIEFIKIVDFDHQVFLINRASLNVSEFDIQLSVNGSDELLLLEDGDSLAFESGETVIV